MATHQYLPPGMQELMREITNGFHPCLVQLLAITPQDEKLAEIAAWCDVVIDGYFTPEEVDKICESLIEPLKLKRENPNGTILVQ